ncbi:guanitoxin biosynthesis heme-dependent pre-guanitoxin N-hydroxylase GntA [Terrabacter sp. C0L_2]|uniref:guanitoxin biosynthesis heme-dependent pre-guanitoxin N-hydroxylase GntA n=1 Tax=Terrabacter sp. C0L_2 TaxID=3108389 RepID=UPI002ED1132E|nr:guanitoxin biosynthesis heme-dependent pre-guanitoxin N-hydroxylase GntA [Terrabacter sp. C0L_2]
MSTDTRIAAHTPVENARLHLPAEATGSTGLSAPEGHHGLEATLDLLAGMDLAHASDADVVRALELMVTHAEFPCLGAKSVFRRGSVAHAVLDDMDDPDVPADLLGRLQEFASSIEGESGFHSFIATFRGPLPSSEASFEASLFGLLQRLHDADDESWADGVGSDPNDPHFAFSAGGTAYFIVGLHPAASRVARRAPLPTLVFNPHGQFEQLRAEGRFDGMRTTIRRRDEDLQGFINPMVADHGDSTEALQYSGRRHAADWEPPLDLKPVTDSTDGADGADGADAPDSSDTHDSTSTHIDQGNRHDDLAGRTTRHD